MSETFTAIEAVLLNSERDPSTEIQAALEAVAGFALLECEDSKEGFLSMCEKAWRTAEAREEVGKRDGR